MTSDARPQLRPADLMTTPVPELAQAWHTAESIMLGYRRGLTLYPPEQLRRLAIESLALGAALAAAMTITRWPSAVTALHHGVTLPELAAALGLDVDEVALGLRSWADEQRGLRERQGPDSMPPAGISASEHAFITAAVADAAAAATGTAAPR